MTEETSQATTGSNGSAGNGIREMKRRSVPLSFTHRGGPPPLGRGVQQSPSQAQPSPRVVSRSVTGAAAAVQWKHQVSEQRLLDECRRVLAHHANHGKSSSAPGPPGSLVMRQEGLDDGTDAAGPTPNLQAAPVVEQQPTMQHVTGGRSTAPEQPGHERHGLVHPGRQASEAGSRGPPRGSQVLQRDQKSQAHAPLALQQLPVSRNAAVGSSWASLFDDVLMGDD